MFKRVTLFRFFGFDVKADASWLFITILLAWSFSEHLFPNLFPNRSVNTYQLMALGVVSGLFLSIVIHEVAHALIAEHYDMPIESITLFFFGGVAEMKGEPSHAKGECLMSLAGPAMSAILGLFCLACADMLRIIAGYSSPVFCLDYLGRLNLILAAFNMIPAFPMDGGRALRALLWGIRKNMVLATRQAAEIGEIFSFMTIAYALYQVVYDNSIMSGLWLGIGGLYMNAAVNEAVRQIESRALLGMETVERFLSDNIISVSPDILISELVDKYMFVHFQRVFPVVHQGALVGTINLRNVLMLDRNHWAWRHVGNVMESVSETNSVGPDYNAADALDRMKKHGQESLLVMKDGQFMGIVTLRDLATYLSVILKLDHTRPISASR